MLKRPDFTACYEAGCRLFLKHFVVFVCSRAPDEEDWRLGMAVTKKVGTAVVRNRIKRVLREFFRLHQALLPPALDLVVIPKKNLRPDTVCLDMVEKELLPFLHDLGKRCAFLPCRASSDPTTRFAAPTSKHPSPQTSATRPAELQRPSVLPDSPTSAGVSGSSGGATCREAFSGSMTGLVVP